MRLVKKRIPAVCLIICAALAFILSGYPRAEAALQVNMEKKGSLSLSLGDDSGGMGEDMLRIADPISVRIWKLADIQETGKYSFREAFKTLSLEGESWKQISEDALALVFETEGDQAASQEPKIEPDHTLSVQIEEGKAGPEITHQEELAELELGLYLIVLGTAESPKYEYSFTPMIVSLPWSEYQYVGSGGDDAWHYDREAVLKPSRIRHYGNVRITKTLDNYNASQGDVTFVFDITARDGDDVVYNNVVSMTFSAAGTQELTIEKIPAEALVTVQELYSGANCQVIAADDEAKSVPAANLGGVPVSFSFVNRYDGGARRGYGIENRFRYNTEKNEYEWTTNRPDIGGSSGTVSGGDAH